jgi:hypothetical protein
MVNSRFWYNSTQTDAKLRKCSSLQLLVLGCLHVLGTSASQIVVQTNTNIDQEVHQQLFLLWLRHMHAIKNEFIFMPRNAEELEIISSDYHTLGLPGCCGSADGVHIGWDRCPAQLLRLYKGKESYPSIAYNVVLTNRRFIQSVSQGHPGARNDKHMCQLDNVLMLLQHGPSFLHSAKWNALTLDSQIKEETGYYLIVDGGYLRWPTLICPVNDDECFLLWSKMVEGAQKDAEDTFGTLKGHFHYIKNWNKLNRQETVDHVFVTCCILHNMQLEQDGFTDPDLCPPTASALRHYRQD